MIKYIKHETLSRLRAGARVAGACCALLLLSASASAGDDAPAWLRQAASLPAPATGDAPAVVLMDEGSVRVEEDGRVISSLRYAIRILKKEGKSAAVARAVYRSDSSKVREIRAWMIRPSGAVQKYDKDYVQDLALSPEDVYNEIRVRSIRAHGDAEPGAVFGYETVTEEKSVFTQLGWQFQTRLPVVASRLSITLPSGWRAEAMTFNHPKIEPRVTGSTYTWELRDLPFIDHEPASPPVTNLAPRMAVGFFPPEGVKGGLGRTFDTWKDVSRWLTELSQPQAAPDAAIAQKARALAAGAKTELERIQAIGRFVQSINYISIQTNIGFGGGYRPHAAAEVFAKSYGDCKDKANLMLAMLKVLDIPSYLLTIYSGDPTFVRPEWPSPQQFNHCIIAIKVGDETKASAVVIHPSLGRLLVFDPTDDSTLVGDLPDHEQGSFALLVAGDDGALLRMPVTPPDANQLERRAEVVLGPDGSISATIRERAAGQSAVDLRREFRAYSRPEYLKAIEAWVAGGATGAKVSKVDPADSSTDGRFALDVTFTAERYGQVMAGRLLVFKPAIVSRRDSLLLTEPSRKHPVVLDSQSYSETVSIKLPEGFVIDELPDAVKLDAAFGTYSTAYEVKEGLLHFTRRMVLSGATIPANDYAKVRVFFEKMRAAEQSPVVLAKK